MNLPDIRRAGERALITTEWLESRCSFNFGPFTRPGREHFGALRVLNEDWIEPAGNPAFRSRCEQYCSAIPRAQQSPAKPAP